MTHDGYIDEVSARDRVYDHATGSRDGRQSIVLVLLCLSLFTLLCSISCRQVTSPGPAKNVLSAGIASLVDIDLLIADEGPALRQAALDNPDAAQQIPGYPLDIVLTRQELTGSSDAQLRELVLERSSSLVYARGLSAFDRTGSQSLRTFSLQGTLKFVLGQLSSSNHSRATFLAVLSLFSSALLAAFLAAVSHGWQRMRFIGIAAAAAALPVLLGSLLLRYVVGSVGGDDPFVEGIRDVTRSVIAVPLRNGAVVLIAGLLVVAASMVLSLIEGRSAGVSEFEEDW